MARAHLLQLRATAEQRQMIDQAAAAEDNRRTEIILRSCQEQARDALLDPGCRAPLWSIDAPLPHCGHGPWPAS